MLSKSTISQTNLMELAPGAEKLIFNKETGEIIKIVPKSPQAPRYQDVFGHTIVELAEKNDKIMGVTSTVNL